MAGIPYPAARWPYAACWFSPLLFCRVVQPAQARSLKRRFPAVLPMKQLPHIEYEQPALGPALGRAQAGISQHAEQLYTGREASGTTERSTVSAAPKNENDAFTAFIANAKNALPTGCRQGNSRAKGWCGLQPLFALRAQRHGAKPHSAVHGRHTQAKPDRQPRYPLPRLHVCADNPPGCATPNFLATVRRAAAGRHTGTGRADRLATETCFLHVDACPHAASQQRRAGQMVFACTGQPQALKTLDERLRSRLESGLVVELMEPDLDVRMRYLQAMCKERNMRSFTRPAAVHSAALFAV